MSHSSNLSQNRVTKTEFAFVVCSQIMVGLWTLWILNRPMVIEKNNHIAQANNRLNGLAHEFWDQNQRWPMRNGGVWELAIEGLIDYKSERQQYYFLTHNFKWSKHKKQFVWKEPNSNLEGESLI